MARARWLSSSPRSESPHCQARSARTIRARPQPALVAQRLSEGLALTGVVDALRPLAQDHQAAACIEVEVDRSLPPLRLLWEMPQRIERLLKKQAVASR